jgi:hypothetical protein
MKYATWESFWGTLSVNKRELFRLLQQTHSELDSVRSFDSGLIHSKISIEEYVEKTFKVDLNNLPQEKKND